MADLYKASAPSTSSPSDAIPLPADRCDFSLLLQKLLRSSSLSSPSPCMSSFDSRHMQSFPSAPPPLLSLISQRDASSALPDHPFLPASEGDVFNRCLPDKYSELSSSLNSSGLRRLFPGDFRFRHNSSLPSVCFDSDAEITELSHDHEEGANLVSNTLHRSRSSSKRSRAAEVHNLSEKKRRSKINEKMKALQMLIPNSNKTDKASMLDEAIEYLKQLQLQVQMLSTRNGSNLHQTCLSEELQFHQSTMCFNDVNRLSEANTIGSNDPTRQLPITHLMRNPLAHCSSSSSAQQNPIAFQASNRLPVLAPPLDESSITGADYGAAKRSIVGKI